MTDPATTRARRTWQRQFSRLYIVALIVTLIPFIAAWVLPKYVVRSTVNNAAMALTQGQLDEAIARAEEALRADPSSERAQAIRINALFERFWETKSDVDLRTARTLAAKLESSRDSQALVARGNLTMIDGDPKRAVELMTEAIGADPNDAYAHHQLGFALNEAGRTDDALTRLKQALALSPQMAWVQVNLASVLTKLERCDEKIEGLNPEVNAACHDEVGVKLFNGGKAVEGRRHFERAVQISGGNGGYHANLAIALLQTGDRAGAIRHADHARKLGVKEHPVFAPLGIR